MLPKENRLTKKTDFENIRQNGRYITTSKLFTISFLNKKDEENPRIGFIVSKKISTKAVERNKIKRTLREIIRKNISYMKTGMDYVIIVKPGILHISHDKLEIELKNVISSI